MPENQNIEYKETWRIEYLKWICGFANAQGGTLYIGIDDSGNIIGVDNAKKLLEDIPNQIQQSLGIIADVNKHTENGRDYIEIKVEPSAYPVNYHGEYHYRSGSTKQQLTGIALTQFIMKKTGFRWEDVTVDNVKVEDLDYESFKIFRREALRKGRMSEEELNVPNEELLQKLHLMSDGKLKRSAVLLFYDDPAIVQNGILVQVGKFGEGADLQYQDMFEGSLISTADKIIDVIYLKYLKAKITFEHDRRVETYPYARDAIREAIFNAMIHNCYMFGSPIQIRIEDEQIIISNQCILPEGWTIETFMEKHESMPYNPDIANVFYRAGYIEHWGRGIQKICDACRNLGAELPTYQLRGNSLRVFFPALKSALIDTLNPPKDHNSSLFFGKGAKKEQKKSEEIESRIEAVYLEICRNPHIRSTELERVLGITKKQVELSIKALQQAGRIKRKGHRMSEWITMEQS